MRVLLATDAWTPQINGVVKTYLRLRDELERMGIELAVIEPSQFKCVPCPSYPQIPLALPSRRRAARLIEAAEADTIHIATEGPIGWMVRGWCLRHGMPFTTSFHTRFADYVSARWPVPDSWGYAFQRRFHAASSGVMVATRSLAQDLAGRGFVRLQAWTRGVDMDVFQPAPVRVFGPEPVFLYVGRVAVEKNIEAFLDLTLPGRKVVVGDGPQLAVLKERYPAVTFTGVLHGAELTAAYASADVFVFPSRTDTFGMVLLEAIASGLPVAAYPATGPKDVVVPSVSGVLSEDLGVAARAALSLDREGVRRAAEAFTWRAAAQLFIENIEVARRPEPQRRGIPAGGPHSGALSRLGSRGVFNL